MVKIYSYRYPAINKDKPIGIIYLIHGYTDHLGNKAHIARKFAEAGYDVVGLDMKGFGRSEGARCYIKSEEDLLNNHLLFQRETQNFYKDKLGLEIAPKGQIPIFISGLSMGGGIAMQLAIRDPERY